MSTRIVPQTAGSPPIGLTRLSSPSEALALAGLGLAVLAHAGVLLTLVVGHRRPRPLGCSWNSWARARCQRHTMRLRQPAAAPCGCFASDPTLLHLARRARSDLVTAQALRRSSCQSWPQVAYGCWCTHGPHSPDGGLQSPSTQRVRWQADERSQRRMRRQGLGSSHVPEQDTELKPDATRPLW